MYERTDSQSDEVVSEASIVRFSRKKSSSAPIYANVFSGYPETFFDHTNHKLSFGNPLDYELKKYIAYGTFCNVFEGVLIATGEKRVIKVLKPGPLHKIQREVRMLEYLRGGPNIIKFMQTVQDPTTKMISLIFEHVDNENIWALYISLTDLDMRFYMMEILKGLDYMHSKGVMHRDLKPNNVVIDHKTHTLRLIDFGLSDFYRFLVKNGREAGTLQFKAPELLTGYPMYDYAVDMWGFGNIVGIMVFLKCPLFHGHDEVSQLKAISRVLGTQDLILYIKKYNIKLNECFLPALQKCEKVSWDAFLNSNNFPAANIFVYDLLDKVLRYDHAERLTAKEAMAHPYFLPIREGKYQYN